MAAITNEIYIGKDKNNPDFYFLNSEIVSVNAVNSVDLVAEELAIDSLEAVIQHHVDRGEVFTPTDAEGIITADDYLFCGHQSADLRLVPFGTPVWYYSGEHYIGQYYVDHIERIGKDQYRLKAVSLIGIFDKKPYYGGVYDAASNTTFGSLVRDIFLGDGAQVYQGYDSVRLYGYSYIYTHFGNTTSTYERVHFAFIFNGIAYIPEKTQSGYDFNIWGRWSKYDYPSMEYEYYSRLVASPAPDGAILLKYQYLNQTVSKKTEWETPEIIIKPGEKVDFTLSANIFDHKECFVIINGHVFAPPFAIERISSNTIFGIDLSKTSSTGIYSGVILLSLLDCTLLNYEVDYKSDKPSRIIPYTQINSDVVRLFLTGAGTMPIYTASEHRSPTPGNPIRVDQPGFVWYSAEESELFDRVKFDEGIADYPVYGWLPVQSKREALYQLMFAYDVNLIKTENDSVMFTWIYASDPAPIPDNRIYDSGEVVYDALAKRIELTEHSYIKSGESDYKILYDNQDGVAEDILVTFPEPYYDLTPTNLTILYANANCAYISGIGTLKGKPYVHGTNVKVKLNDDNPGGSTVSVTDATLVGVHNSENVMKRLYDYYTKRQTVKNSIVLSGEECGKNYAFLDPFYDRSHGYIRKMDISGSAILKADCEIITDYAPTGQGSNYSHSVVLSGSGTWTVPDEVFEKDVPSIRVYIIGGGNGGDSGLKGQDGKAYKNNYHFEPLGGENAENALGGKIYAVTIQNPLVSYDYQCGDGGKGGSGQCDSETIRNIGLKGGISTFGEYTSDSGLSTPDGITDFKTGKIYGRQYPRYPAFMRAGSGGYVFVYNDRFYFLGGSDANSYLNSGVPNFLGGTTVMKSISLVSGQWTGSVYGGGGGGAAIGENGHDGANPSSNNWDTIYTGNGGNGGNATIKAQNATEYGCGGWGGYGGGGGGNTGYFFAEGITVSPGTPGVGGYGGEGGDGAPGCILIYY